MPSSRAASPQGEYGAGSVIVWDRGRWSTEGDPHQQLAKGHLIVDLDGSKLKGRWHLVHMRGRDQRGKENWLLIKAEDEYARADGGADLLEEKPRSIKTGRTIEDVADSDGQDQAEAPTSTESGAPRATPRTASGRPAPRRPNQAKRAPIKGARPARCPASSIRSSPRPPPSRPSARAGCTR